MGNRTGRVVAIVIAVAVSIIPRGRRWNSGPIRPSITVTTKDAIAGAVGMDGTIVGGDGVSQRDGRYSSTIEDDPLHRANRASSNGLASAQRWMHLLRECDRTGPAARVRRRLPGSLISRSPRISKPGNAFSDDGGSVVGHRPPSSAVPARSIVGREVRRTTRRRSQ